ncbi:sterol desaturase family protein [Streptomyces xiamenensis]|uniref:sterol desaturase family protein n=1 Tax=Streptomyces xiamenensis TaxID=408015 RepID=UPI0037D57AD5
MDTLPETEYVPIRSNSLLRKTAYPLLLFALVATVASTLAFGWDLSTASMPFLIGTIAYLAILERLIPHNPDWHPSRREWGRYGIYYALTTIGSVIAELAVLAGVERLSPDVPRFGLAVEIPLALLVGSLASYLIHRWGHTNTYLWRLHGVHHAPDKVNVANNGVNHVLDIMISQGIVQLALALAGFSAQAVFAVGLFVVAQGFFVHANIDVRTGWVGYVLASPEQHRLHHSTELSEAGHYGSDLSIWDSLFGSFTWYPGRRPERVGLHDPTSFPPTDAVVASMIHPFRQARQRDRRPTSS